MVDKHSQSFFGQSTGLTLLSSSRSDPYLYFKCIQKKQNGSWEKPSAGEGKTIKCSLDELIMILQVLKKMRKHGQVFIILMIQKRRFHLNGTKKMIRGS
ncbi:MAG: hypothetical protein ACFFAK_03370 [Promethearchaeota archaeon]